MMKIINLPTIKGNAIIHILRREGWTKTKEYSWLAFDKGIDFDSYELHKDGQLLAFTWTNWFEWEVTGSCIAVSNLAQAYCLPIEDNTAD